MPPLIRDGVAKRFDEELEDHTADHADAASRDGLEHIADWV